MKGDKDWEKMILFLQALVIKRLFFFLGHNAIKEANQ